MMEAKLGGTVYLILWKNGKEDKAMREKFVKALEILDWMIVGSLITLVIVSFL